MRVIRRKLVTAETGTETTPSGALAAWRLGFARAARKRLQLDLTFANLQLQRMSLAEVLERLPDRAMIATLEGPKEALGLLAMAPGLMTGLIEKQTFGRITGAPPLSRRPTRIDAAMISAVADLALTGMESELAISAERTWTEGFRFGSHIEDPRPLGLLLEDEPYCVMTADITFEGVDKGGELILVLPAEGRGRRPEPRQAPDPAVGAQILFRNALAEQVRAAEAQLVAVLARRRMSLREVLALEPGQLINLGDATIERVDLQGLDGKRVAGGRLGQNRGMRALRLSEETRPAERTGQETAESVVALRPTGSDS